MSTVSAREWVSRITETLISAASLPVFLLLDILDVIMCLIFRLLDRFLEGTNSSCYCHSDITQPPHSETELSESLHGRKNIVREMLRLLKFPVFLTKNGTAPASRANRWSDCGCESCLSWMNHTQTHSNLHLLLKQPQRDANVSENVIFIHGFLSSSSLWKETVFLNLSENSRRNYRLFAVDLLGFGRSPKPEDCLYTLRDHVEMIERSVIVPFELDSFHLVAHSMGCVIALALAAKHSASVKSITLVAPPYFSASSGDATGQALKRIAARRVWPPLLFFSAFMSWYEHLGRCVCFLLCRNHRLWEWILMLVTRRRDLHFLMTDVTRHTHHSAWHTMHNVVCGGARFLDGYLEVLRAAGARILVVQGRKDEVVPVECSLNLKVKDPEIELQIIPNLDHSSVILGRAEEFTRDLERFWAS
ncbi:probable lysophospholipase BODYGUARD 4 [Salvia splendens]|uniref:probable lysophospholipase BODYGUARD 4 n=1 Tax=Salvia splendens TaxID=180675 RepID=UPI001C27A11C|nr:probable lysophospholipase BODYGUARD 4 [Salvia splendens]